MPNIVIDYLSLSIIPRSHPEELNNVSLCDRLNRLEEQQHSVQRSLDNSDIHRFALLEERMRQMQESIDTVVAENVALREKTKTTAYSNAVRMPPPAAIPRQHNVKNKAETKYPTIHC